MAVLLAGSLLPCLLIKVLWPNSRQAELEGGFPWKAVNKELGTKSEDWLCWKKKGALVSLGLFVNIFLMSRLSLLGLP